MDSSGRPEPTLARFVQGLQAEGTTVVGDLASGHLKITTYLGEPVDPPIFWHITEETFQAAVLQCADPPSHRPQGASALWSGMPTWGTSIEEWLEDEMAVRRGESPRLEGSPPTRSKYASKKRAKG